MTDVEKSETKAKILKVASELFSKFGFNGTSVRDIAQASEVNVASINYYFGSKHNLYWSVIQESHAFLEKGIKGIASRVDCIENMTAEAYDFLMSDKDVVRTALRIMLTDGVPEPEGELREAMEARMGPPGTEHFTKVLRKQLGQQIPDQKIFFAVNAIFGNMLHWSMICSCSKIEGMRNKRPELQPEAIKESLRMHARAICQFIDSESK